MEQFYVDGNTRERINDYAQWRVVDSGGNVVCSFFGPMSLLAAMTFCERLRGGNAVPEILDLPKYLQPR